MLDLREHGVRRRSARIIGHKLLERLIRASEHTVFVKGFAHMDELSLRDPRLKKLADLLASTPPITLLPQIEAEVGF